jgi:lipopolysaccharide transport system permease protein
MEASFVAGYFSDIWRLRHFWMALVSVDLRKRYRRSVLGMGWSLLHPIAMTLVLCIFLGPWLAGSRREYAPFLLSGLTFWALIMASVTQGCQSFLNGESYIRQHPAPLAIYPLRVTLAAGVHFLLGFGLALVVVWCLHGFGNLLVLATLLPTFALLFVFCWSLAICMGIANVMFQDSQHIIEIAMQVAFYSTPILWKPEMAMTRRLVSWGVRINPLAAFLELIRQPLLEGELPSRWAVGLASLGAVVVATVAMLLLRRFEKKMIFYL